MKHSIRVRFFLWLGIQTALIFAGISIVLLVFNLHERHEHPELREEESEEALLVGGVMALLLPLALGSAWLVSKRLLYPWQDLVAQAERISAGHLDERIEVETPHDEIGRLAATLNQAFDRYQTLLDRLQRFQFDASHQLRNPLAAIRASGEICLGRPRSPEAYRAVIGGILEDTGRLSRTVDQLLMLARAAQGALDAQRESVAVSEVVGAAVHEARTVGEERGVRVDLHLPAEPLTLRVVPDLIREALTNFLDNALRFSPDGGAITVDVRQASSDRIRISVEDEGPGLSPDRRATLFRPFVRGGDAGRERSGLGLAIVADICRAHGGAAGVDGAESGGSRFWMELPTRP